MAIAFTVSVGVSDWSPELSGWRCPALSIPGAEVDAVYVPGGRVDKAWYEIPEGLSIIRWVHGTLPPDKATLALKLTKELSTQELTSKWKKLAIALPFISSLLVGAISTFVPPRRANGSTSLVWTIKGAVKNSGEFQYYDVATSVMPPDLRLKPDYTFEGTLPIETRNDGSLVLPNVILTLNKVGFDTPVVHLVNPGEKLPTGVLDDYNQSIDATHHVVDIRKPIEFHRGNADPPFRPTQIPVPVRP